MVQWRCGADRDLEIVTREKWDGDVARDAIFAWAGWPNEPDSARARRAFLAWDSAEPDLQGSYRLPFCTVEGEELVAVDAGIRAAASRLSQTDVPDGIKETAREVIDRYEAMMDEEEEEEEEDRSASVDDRLGLVATTARVRAASVTDEWMELARTAAPDPSIFDDAPPFFWSAEISSTDLDAYFTRMHRSTLRNFAADAQDGVSFQNSHRQRELGFGRSIRGKFTGAQGNGRARTIADFYTIPGLNLNGMETDQLIRGIRSGIVKDVSVGFYGGTFRCDICGRDMWRDYDCPHYPGAMYEVEGKKDRVQCTATIEEGRLAEVSAVYDGATPGAGILKARARLEEGLLDRNTARMLEPLYRARIWTPPRRSLVKTRLFPTNTSDIIADVSSRNSSTQRPEGKETVMPDEGTKRGTPDTGTTAPAPAPENGTNSAPEFTAPEERSVPDTEAAPAPEMRILPEPTEWTPAQYEQNVRAVLAGGEVAAEAVRECVRRLVEEVQQLRPEASDGRRYRQELIEETLRQGVAAWGEAFDVEMWRAQAGTATLEFIKSLRDNFARTADGIFSGGRRTLDDYDREEPTRTVEIPVSAYRA